MAHLVTIQTNPKWDTQKTMKAVQWQGTKNIKVVNSPRPKITDPKDVIIKISSTSICGSDLHLYHNEVQGMKSGDIIGHEIMGFVDEVGDAVKDLVVGDRVVVSAIIACGECYYCSKEMYSCCDTTNPSETMEQNYGHRTAGIFGYSHLTGGFPGGQAEYVRVPIADVNCLKVPEGISDEKLLFLSDILCTSYHACELGDVKEGKTVAIWGAGPVGLLTAAWAKYKNASRVILIDNVKDRLRLAVERLGCEVIDFGEKDVIRSMHQMIPGGPDICIDCAGYSYSTSLVHRVEKFLKLETDAPQVLSEMIFLVKKGGNISLIGEYFATTNHFPIGALMKKSITLKGGEVFVQKYWKKILEILKEDKFDPTFIITHVLPLDRAEDAYKLFDKKEDGLIKVVLKNQV